MGNSNTKKYYAHRQYASQYSLSDIIGGQCVRTPRSSCEELRPWSRFSRKSWSENTLNDPLNLSKTAWPVPRFEAIFLPEFPVREAPLKQDYVFIDIISKGAYGRVYKVQKIETKEIFALKIISKAKIVAENAVQQAKQEVSIQKAIGHHTFIANSPYHWQGRKTLYILTQFIGGGELFSLVREYGSLPEEVVRIYIGEIALALDFLHNAGIIHRDLKASNILLDNEGHAMLIDFGLAKWLRPLQRTGTFCGTFEYMAPEIVKRQYYGHEADWWSLGVLACFLLTNEMTYSYVQKQSTRPSQLFNRPSENPKDSHQQYISPRNNSLRPIFNSTSTDISTTTTVTTTATTTTITLLLLDYRAKPRTAILRQSQYRATGISLYS